MNNLNVAITHALNALAATHPLWGALAVGSATYLIWMLAAVALWVSWRNRTVLVLLLGSGIVFAINYAIAALWFRARPSEGITRLISSPHSLKSFPSDHTALSTLFSWIVFAMNPRLGLLMELATLLVGFGRVAVGVHYPTDILGGIIVGSVAYALARYFFR